VTAITDLAMVWRDTSFDKNGRKGRDDMFRSVSLKALKLAFVGFAAAAAVAAMRLYYVQEMLAALILFAILFVCVAVVLLLLLMLDSAGQVVLEFLEVRRKAVLQHARVWHSLTRPDRKRV
jgi:hypothetical protein